MPASMNSFDQEDYRLWAIHGSPEELVNKVTIGAVFGVRVAIVTCPVDGAPLAIPLTGRQK
ncbi:hypothetical protein K1W69_08750 [Hoeflea sp. WL0058]|uniref:Uncharacterized protein n=1 Tax=Flavimaribacter sediminis TaxID=2865987 RepID=A0AAE2ZM92_9HYPH|nr:hypothetical protein [Flavimaribacter sediminis]MBW8637275.1 hypothetical protein [Flavimaribacter sediminis]